MRKRKTKRKWIPLPEESINRAQIHQEKKELENRFMALFDKLIEEAEKKSGHP